MNKKLELLRNIVCNYFDIDINTLTMRRNKREVVEPRQIFMYLVRKHEKVFQVTNEETGIFLKSESNKKPFDHTTVTYATYHIQELIDSKAILKINGEYIHKAVEEIWDKYRANIFGYNRDELSKYINKMILLKYRNNGEKCNLVCTITALNSEAFLVEKEELKLPLTYKQIINIDVVECVNNHQEYN